MAERISESILAEWQLEPDHEELWAAFDELASDPCAVVERLQQLADRGSIVSMVSLGDAYIHGHGVNADNDLGEHWLRRASSNGSIDGAYRLARFLQREGRIDDAQAELVRLAERGFAPAWHMLGYIAYHGQAGEKNIGDAMEYFRKSEAMGSLISKHWLSYILRHEDLGIGSAVTGYFKLVTLFFPYLYYRVFYPQSDKVRDW